MNNSSYTILTGATSGIGYETAKKLAKSGINMILGNRNMEKAELVKRDLLEINPQIKIILIDLDLSSFKSIEHFVETVNKTENVSCLINNAGLFMRQNQKTYEGFEMSMGVNYIGTLYLTELLLEQLRKNDQAKIVMVSSVGCYWGRLSLKENSFTRFRFSFTNYFNSKLACLLYTYDLSQREKKILVKAGDPGIVYSKIFKWRSGFGRFLEKIQRRIMKNPEEGSRVSFKLAVTNEFDQDNHLLFDYKKAKKLPRRLYDDEFSRKYLEYTRQLIQQRGGKLA